MKKRKKYPQNSVEIRKFLDNLNKKYHSLHRKYEELFWISYMGDRSVDKRKNEALKKRDAFRSNPVLLNKVNLYMSQGGPEKKRLEAWKIFFERYQTPEKVFELKSRIDGLESTILRKKAERKEGYIDPGSDKWREASMNKMAMMMRTNPDERVRRACFTAREKLAVDLLDEYVELVGLLNEYARKIGYDDFYSYKVWNEEGLTKKELFAIFNTIYQKTKYVFRDIRNLEKKNPGLRKPWNFGFMMTGDFTAEEDQYFQFEEALERWGITFAALGPSLSITRVEKDFPVRPISHRTQSLARLVRGLWE
jgi:hypothetical protein